MAAGAAMAQVVLIHGIGQQQESADTLEGVWVPALAGGVRTAGFGAIADRLARGDVEVRMAFYGDLFLRPGAQGDDIGDFTEAESELAELLAAEWLSRAAGRSHDPQAQAVATDALAVLAADSAEAMGPGAWIRRLVRATGRIRWFAPTGFALAERFVNRSLKQVSAYLANRELNEEIRARVTPLIDDDTEVVIGHSLGSVVAYEVVSALGVPLPLLVTLGSPLGLGTIVFERVRPQPPKFPRAVRLWVNAADTDDLVAAEPDLSAQFSADMPEGSEFHNPPVDNGARPHSANHYLTKAAIGRPVGTTLEASSWV